MAKCINCGYELEDSARFCPMCGTPQKVSEETPGGEGEEEEPSVTVKHARGYEPVMTPERLPGGYVVDGRFEIRRKLGQGGFGAVYLAWDRNLEVEKALKVLPAVMAEDEEAIADLKEETRTLIGLSHPSIVRVFDLHNDGQLKYIDMEYVPGKSLARMKLEAPGRRLPEEDVVRYSVEVCKALEYAHGRKLIHRDIKPHNIHVLPDGTVKLMDFGIAETIRSTASRVARTSSSGTDL